MVGVVTAVAWDMDGAVESTTNVFTLNALLEFPAKSVTVIVQSYDPSLKESNEMVLVPLLAEVVSEEQEPPKDIVPASFELNE